MLGVKIAEGNQMAILFRTVVVIFTFGLFSVPNAHAQQIIRLHSHSEAVDADRSQRIKNDKRTYENVVREQKVLDEQERIGKIADDIYEKRYGRRK